MLNQHKMAHSYVSVSSYVCVDCANCLCQIFPRPDIAISFALGIVVAILACVIAEFTPYASIV